VAVAIQGEVGSNSARAVELLQGAVALDCHRTFAALFAAFGHSVHQAVVPWQNSIAGLVTEVADGVLQAPALRIRGEVTLAIEFVVAALPGDLALRRVLAHPVAAAQCRRFLASQPWEVVTAHDTAGAAREVLEAGDATLGALCPPSAAARYQLQVRHEGCTDAATSATRFFQLEAQATTPQADDDRSLLALGPQPSLSTALAHFGQAGIELLALHARPISASPFANTLLLEVVGGGAETMAALAPHFGASLRLLASFRVGGRP
jgi:prephenate dehydratase